MTPDMTVSGAPIRRGSWQPHNYDGSTSHANVPMKVALAKSYNLAAVHLLEQVGVQTGAQMVRRFGITNPMAPSLPSALGASEASLLEMVSAYSVFPNKGVRVQPHLIRKVLDRDGKVLEEWNKTTYKVTSEYVALTMVDMMRAVVSGAGTAGGASAAGHPLAGKTGTVNDHTDVWFIGYTPTYVTGVWMGNPARKESLGRGMTGGHGAVPFFNAFMNAFMKDKPKEQFEAPPPIPADIRSLIERRKREEKEKLEKAELEARRSGAIFTPSKRAATNVDGSIPDGTDGATTDAATKTDTSPDTKKEGAPVSNPNPRPENNLPKPQNPPNPPPVKKTDAPADKPGSEGTKRKGKKGDG
jgi:penicillin-binding protein 1A